MTEMSAATAGALEKGQMEKAASIGRRLAEAGEAKLPSFFRKKA